ncbi:MAG: Pr6Pr family membrane protein [Chitinophagaceae bacterium]|nr:Pr6Pr family membrane protein [Chitinophagaceae bacterium]
MEEKKYTSPIYIFGSLISVIAVCLQLWVTINNREVSILDTIIQFFSYFTILTNSLVAIYFTSLWFLPRTKLGLFFKKFTTTTAITVYILVVGIIYNVLLRNIWPVSGWGKVADELLHTCIPIYFLIYWLFFTENEKLKWSDALSWLYYPLAYFTYTLIRGEITHTYPYPFINVNKFGYQQTVINCLGIGTIFYGLFLLMIAISKKRRASH